MSIQHISGELTIHELSNNIINKLESYGIKPKQFVKFKNQFTTKTEDNYIIKMILDSDARKYGSRGYLKEAMNVYNSLATFIATEESGNPIETLSNMQKLSLRQYARQGYTKVRIKNCGQSGCAECRALSNKTIEISEALKKMPLPNRLCSFDLYRNNHSFCRCSYEPVTGNLEKANKKTRYDFTSYKKYLIASVIALFLGVAIFNFINN